MVRKPVRARKAESGQAILLVILAMSLFLFGALGFTIDGSHLIAQRNMAQSAADAAAQAGMMDLFNLQSGAVPSSAWETPGSYSCSTYPNAAPCWYASKNGFNTATDTVTFVVSFSNNPNYSQTDFTGNQLQVVVQRSVATTLMQFLGPTMSTVSASATAAIVTQPGVSPVVITNPTNANSLTTNAGTTLTVCGGPKISVAVNSYNAAAYGGGGTIDLTQAGPSAGGACPGTGGYFGVFGGDNANPGSITPAASYISPASPVPDPLSSAATPLNFTLQTNAQPLCTGADCNSCPGGAATCTEYSPGTYSAAGGGINVPAGGKAIFKPGVYDTLGGFTLGNNSMVAMCASCAVNGNTGNGMVVYDTGTSTGTCDASGGFNIGTGVTATLIGAKPAGTYPGILFYEDRQACATTHTFGGGAAASTLSIGGAIYINNSQAGSGATVTFNNITTTVNQIVVSQLNLTNGTKITVNPYATGPALTVRRVALVG